MLFGSLFLGESQVSVILGWEARSVLAMCQVSFVHMPNWYRVQAELPAKSYISI